MTNPLIQAYRKPALYVSLPSGGKFYDPKPKLSVDGELAIYAMTARDELISKTPDALFNGEATFAIISSCCPDIPNARQMPVNDLLVVLLAIRQATYGKELNVDIKCPECSEINMLAVDANRVLATSKPLTSDGKVKIGDNFTVILKPYNLEDRTLLQIQQIKQRKMVESLTNPDLPEERRNELFGTTFVELADLTVDLITNCILAVRMEGSEEVSDNETIKEWLKSITKPDYDKIKAKVEELSKHSLDTSFNATCQSCNHSWKTNVDLDMANFFAG